VRRRTRRQDRLLAGRIKEARFRDPAAAQGRFVERHQDALLLGPPGTGKSHLAQALGLAAIQQGHRVAYREVHVPLLILDGLGMRKLPSTGAEDLLELIARRCERTSTLLTSNRPVDDWGKLLGDTATVSAMLDRLLHHAHVLECEPKSWRTRPSTTSSLQETTANR
jgi:DNA replication protein DnaC